MSWAVIPSGGAPRTLDARQQADATTTADDVQDPQKLARLVQELRADVAMLKGSWRPDVVEFQDVTVGAGGAPVSLRHAMGGRVRWYAVAFQSLGGGWASLERDPSSTNDTLTLLSYVDGTVTVRVERAG